MTANAAAEPQRTGAFAFGQVRAFPS